ncbi:MAG: hypothetical protein AAGB12_05260 [Pseudomonadota bacterium]
MKYIAFILSLFLTNLAHGADANSGQQDIISVDVGPCTGTATECVTVRLAGWTTQASCQTSAAAACDATKESCKLIYAGVLAAKMANRKVRLYSHGGQCSVRGNSVGIANLTFFEIK